MIEILASSPVLIAIVSLVILFPTIRLFRRKKVPSAILHNLEKRKAFRDQITHRVLASVTEPEILGDSEAFLDAYEICARFKKGLMNASSVMKECIARSHFIGNRLLNAVTEELYDEAFDTASQIDKSNDFENTPILFGIPISIKDSFSQRGCDATCGSAFRAFKPYEDDGLVVAALREVGAIPFVRSNVPQLLMMPESDNALWGRSLNPWNLSRNPGGSSGGEGALVASGCSILGLGSDIGGSIRIPAHFCGIVGFKPTPQRITKRGLVIPRKDDLSGQIVIESTCGPMARSVRDCVEVMAALTSSFTAKNDKFHCRLPIQKSLCLSPSRRSLKIAYFHTDNWFEPILTCKRAVDMAIEALKKRGHDVVPFALKDFGKDVALTYITLMGADGNWFLFRKSLEGEELHRTYRMLQKYTEIPNFMRPIIASVLRKIGECRKADMMMSQKSGGLSVREYYDAICQKIRIEKKFMDVFENNGYDALVFPPVGICAPPHDMIGDLLPSLSYSFLANLLHWPAGVVPITLVNKDECNYDIDSLPQYQRDSMASLVKNMMQTSEGLPVGVQVMTRKWQDEECLFVMKEIEEEIRFRFKPTFKSS